MILEKMPTGKLENLRAEVEAMIAMKVAERRQELQWAHDAERLQDRSKSSPPGQQRSTRFLMVRNNVAIFRRASIVSAE